VPEGETRDGIERAAAFSRDAAPAAAAHELGSGYRVTAQDTVPFTLWCAARHLDSYEEAFWNTLEGLGDRDTTCAIVGGIVALATGRSSIPAFWLATREPLK
jgi:ADP-ribosylglycohydrolase